MLLYFCSCYPSIHPHLYPSPPSNCYLFIHPPILLCTRFAPLIQRHTHLPIHPLVITEVATFFLSPSSHTSTGSPMLVRQLPCSRYVLLPPSSSKQPGLHTEPSLPPQCCAGQGCIWYQFPGQLRCPSPLLAALEAPG